MCVYVKIRRLVAVTFVSWFIKDNSGTCSSNLKNWRWWRWQRWRRREWNEKGWWIQVPRQVSSTLHLELSKL